MNKIKKIHFLKIKLFFGIITGIIIMFSQTGLLKGWRFNEKSQMFNCQQCDFKVKDFRTIHSHIATTHISIFSQSEIIAQFQAKDSSIPDDGTSAWLSNIISKPNVQLNIGPNPDYFSFNPPAESEIESNRSRFLMINEKDLPYQDALKNYSLKLEKAKVTEKFATQYLDLVVDIKGFESLSVDESAIRVIEILENVIHQAWRPDDKFNTYQHKIVLLTNDLTSGNIGTGFLDNSSLALQTILGRLEQVLNSNEGFLINNGFRMHVIRQLTNKKGGVNWAYRGCGSYRTRVETDLVKWLKTKNTVIDFNNTEDDELCLFYAILYGQMHLKRKEAGKGVVRKADFKKSVKLFKNVCKLCSSAKIPPAACGLEEIEKLQMCNELNGFKLVVYDLDDSCAIFYDNPKIPSETFSRINIGMVGNHFYYLRSLEALLDKSICHRCNALIQAYDQNNHKCPNGCVFCHKAVCKNLEMYNETYFTCEKCSFTFRTKLCHDAHILIKDCEKFVKCKQCHRKISRNKMSKDGEHKNCEQRTCQTCHTTFNFLYPHYCFVKTYVPKLKSSRRNNTNENKDNALQSDNLLISTQKQIAKKYSSFNNTTDDRISPVLMTDEFVSLGKTLKKSANYINYDDDDDNCAEVLPKKNLKSPPKNNQPEQYEVWYFDLETVVDEKQGNKLIPILACLMSTTEYYYIFTGQGCIYKMMQFIIFEINNLDHNQDYDDDSYYFNPTDGAARKIGPAGRNKTERVLIAHNSSRFDSILVLETLSEMNLKFSIRNRGNSILCLNIKHHKVTIKDSFLFLPFALAKFPETFTDVGMEMAKGDFPHSFNKLSNIGYIGPMPSIDNYDVNKMEGEKFIKFVDWYKKEEKFHAVPDQPWIYWHQLSHYCHLDTLILKRGCEQFRKEVFNITKLDCFIESFTLASFTQQYYNYEYLKENVLPIIDEKGFASRQDSNLARSFILALQNYEAVGRTEKLQIISLATDCKEAKIDGRLKVDAYFETKNKPLRFGYDFKRNKPKFEAHSRVAVEVNGCYWHGCPKCWVSTQVHPQYKCTFGDLYSKTIRKEVELRKLGYEVLSIFGCEIKELCKSDAEWDFLIKYHSGNENIEPFYPKMAFSGGRVEVFTMIAEENPSKNEQIHYSDIVSLYPYCYGSGNFDFPIGYPKVLPGSDFQTNPNSVVNGSFFGLVYCRILAPEKLFVPLLGIRIRECLMFPLCYQCSLEQVDNPYCAHTVKQRSMLSAWTTVELSKAVNHLGYKIISIHSVWHWDEKSSNLYVDFTNKFLRMKLCASGYPTGIDPVTTRKNAQSYCNSLNKEYNFQEPIQIGDVILNSCLRFVAKLLLNAFWGRWVLGRIVRYSEPIHSLQELFQRFRDPGIEVEDIFPVSKSTSMITCKMNDDYTQMNSTVSYPIGIFTTSYARLHLYSFIEMLQPSQILYCDTDSIVWISQPNNPKAGHIPEGSKMGEMKIEAGDGKKTKITSFVSTGPKSYIYIYTDLKTGISYQITKVKGLTFTAINRKNVTAELMRNSIQVGRYFDREDKTVTAKVSNFTITRNLMNASLHAGTMVRSWSFTNKKRVQLRDGFMGSDQNQRTLPYGYFWTNESEKMKMFGKPKEANRKRKHQ